MSEERLKLLFDAVNRAKQILILPHNDPDPDAITGAIALRTLFEQQSELPTAIAYKGIIGRAENRALVRYLDHPLHPLTDEEFQQATHVALIDTQPGFGNNPWFSGLQVAVVIDHHPWQEQTATATFADVRSVGASSTILTEYLRAANIELSPELATALFYGIKTDTRGLSRGTTPADAAAYFYLQPRIDVEALAEIERAQVPAAYFRSFATTLEATRVYNGVAMSYVGEVEYPDLTAEMADLLSRLEQVEWVICIGVYRSTLLVAVRTPGRQSGAGRMVQSIVGQDGTAGGHGAMAGGQIPLNGRSAKQVIKRIKQRMLLHLGVEQDIVGKLLI